MALAENLHRSLLEMIEPKLYDLESHAIESDGDAGVVLFRVGASSLAPHCSRHDWRSYMFCVRRRMEQRLAKYADQLGFRFVDLRFGGDVL